MAGNMDQFKFKKSLGQNFLRDKNVLNKIINSSNISSNSLIIEIGPGDGALTEYLVNTGNNVLAFEIDQRLKDSLELLMAKFSKLDVVFKDFLSVDINKYLKKYSYEKLYVIANIPYYITTPIITKVIDEINPDIFCIMIQKEVGDRLIAKPNTRNYGSLSVYAQFRYNISKVCDVSKNSFFPKPDVDSVVLRFEKKLLNYDIDDLDSFFKFIKDAFKHKRKNLKNNLYKYDLVKVEKFLKTLNKDLTFRAEQISIEEFVNLYMYLTRK